MRFSRLVVSHSFIPECVCSICHLHENDQYMNKLGSWSLMWELVLPFQLHHDCVNLLNISFLYVHPNISIEDFIALTVIRVDNWRSDLLSCIHTAFKTLIETDAIHCSTRGAWGYGVSTSEEDWHPSSCQFHQFFWVARVGIGQPTFRLLDDPL